MLDLIRIQFLTCSFTPVATELLNQAQLKIYEKWHVSGIKHLLGTLFLRGATHIITDYSHNSPNKMALRQLGKLLQREINLFSNWTFKEMENHLLGMLQQHTRNYPRGFNPFRLPAP
ncbi:MAG: hypothetical protein LLG04_12080 [Parachlamydia sp.]|nr:hypothetical protein [Parachlamydia sp.]